MRLFAHVMSVLQLYTQQKAHSFLDFFSPFYYFSPFHHGRETTLTKSFFRSLTHHYQHHHNSKRLRPWSHYTTVTQVDPSPNPTHSPTHSKLRYFFYRYACFDKSQWPFRAILYTSKPQCHLTVALIVPTVYRHIKRHLNRNERKESAGGPWYVNDTTSFCASLQDFLCFCWCEWPVESADHLQLLNCHKNEKSRKHKMTKYIQHLQDIEDGFHISEHPDGVHAIKKKIKRPLERI